MDIYSVIQQLLNQAKSAGLLVADDEIYARNQILSLLHLSDFSMTNSIECELEIPDLLEVLIGYAVEKEIIHDLLAEKEILSAKIILGCVLKRKVCLIPFTIRIFHQACWKKIKPIIQKRFIHSEQNKISCLHKDEAADFWLIINPMGKHKHHWSVGKFKPIFK
jgi:galactose-1-phosphate uridylyltransferase